MVLEQKMLIKLKNYQNQAEIFGLYLCDFKNENSYELYNFKFDFT